MANGTFNMNTWSEVNINTFLYEADSATSVAVDYILNIGISPSVNLFSTVTYQQNSADAEKYDLNVELNSALN